MYLEPMAIADQYKILKSLGNQKKRKFGATYIVEHKVDGTKAILKATKEPSNTLENESTYNFTFKGLPVVLDYVKSENEQLLLLEYKKGLELKEYWSTLKNNERGTFTIQLLEKLKLIFDRLEQNNIVHCDIKPGNILIEQHKGDFDVHLIDFGLAIRTHEIPKRKILFPLGYAAPELILNYLDIVNPRTDIFALGVVIFQLFTDELPLIHPNPSIFTNLQITHPIPNHSKLPKGLLPILEKMSFKYQFENAPNRMEPSEVKSKLVKGIENRYSNLSEVVDDLKQLKENRKFYQIRSFR